jgi:threonine/homoserine/homoserine lactone efflux protein
MTGCLTAVILIMTASAAGLSAVLAASPRLFQALRYAGVAYLVWLGIKAWRGRGSPIDVGATSLAAAPLSNGSLFRGGFIIGLCNPKLLMFAAAFLPQFIDRAAPQAPQFAIIVGTFAVAESFWYAVYGLGGRTLATYLTRPVLIRLFNRITGGIFVGFGVALLRLEP